MRIAILGAGVTGLTAAYHLNQSDHEVLLFEASGRVGGVVRSDWEGGWLSEAGPQSLRGGSTDTMLFLDELGLTSEIALASIQAGRRFLARGNGLDPLPKPGPRLLFSRAVPLATKFRFGAEPFRRPFARPVDVSFAALVRDHFGEAALDRLGQPLVSGIWAGDPERLSARHAFPWAWKAEHRTGSLLRAAAKARTSPAVFSFRRGMQQLPDRIFSRLPKEGLRLNAAVTRITPAAGGRWTLEWKDGKEEVDRVVVALPAWALAGIDFGQRGGALISSVAEIEHPPLVSLFLGYRRDQVAHALDGFGALVPASEGRTVLGIIFCSSLFEDHAPEGHVALRVLAGGALQPDLARLPAPEFARRVQADLADLLGVCGEPVYVKRQTWDRSIPQYNLGYERHLAAMDAFEKENPGIYIGGQARNGISIPQLLKAGASLAFRAIVGSGFD